MKDYLNISNDKNKFRPISAVNKNPYAINVPNIYNSLITSNNNYINNPIIPNSINKSHVIDPLNKLSYNKYKPKVDLNQNKFNFNHNSLFNDLLTKPNQNYSSISKERLYEELLHFKQILNKLKKENLLLKAENNKKDFEITKKDKLIEDIAIENEYNDCNAVALDLNSPLSKINKAKEQHLLSSMKTQFKLIKEELKNKELEVNNLKKTLKITKVKELQIEVETLSSELSKLKNFYSISLQQNYLSDQNKQEIDVLKLNLNQQDKIISKQESIIKELEINFKNTQEENLKLKDCITINKEKIYKLNKEIKYLKEVNFNLNKSKDDNNRLSNIRKSYEEKISELNSEINRILVRVSDRERDIAKEKEKIKELNNQIKQNKIQANFDDIKDIVRISKSPEESEDTKLIIYKSKLNKEIKQKANILKYVNYLEDTLKKNNIVFNYDKFNSIDNNNNNYDNLNQNNNTSNNNKLDINKSIQTNNMINSDKQINETKYNNKENDNNYHNNISYIKEKDNLNNSYNSYKKSNKSNTKSKLNKPTDFNTEEFTYILLKNLEGFEYDYNVANKFLLKDLDKFKSNSNELINEVSNRIFKVLNLRSEEDKQKIQEYITIVYKLKDFSIDGFTNDFNEILKNLKIYSAKEKVYYSKKIKKHFKPYYEKLEKLIKNILDYKNNNKFITFYKFREIMEELDINIKDKYTEFIIYYMKSSFNKDNANFNNEDCNNFYNLDYNQLVNIINNSDEDSNPNSSLDINSCESLDVYNSDFNNSKEILELNEDILKRVNNILENIYNYFSNLTKTSKNKDNISLANPLVSVFKDDCFRPQSEDGQELDICINLEDFLKFLSDKVNYNCTDVDKYCIFKKYSLDEDYEVISLEKIEADLSNINLEVTFNNKNKENNKINSIISIENKILDNNFDDNSIVNNNNTYKSNNLKSLSRFDESNKIKEEVDEENKERDSSIKILDSAKDNDPIIINPID